MSFPYSAGIFFVNLKPTIEGQYKNLKMPIFNMLPKAYTSSCTMTRNGILTSLITFYLRNNDI